MSKTMALAARLLPLVLMLSLEAQGTPFDREMFSSPLRVASLDKESAQNNLAMALLDPENINLVHPASFEVNMTLRYPPEWNCVNVTFDSTPSWITTRPDDITVCGADDFEGGNTGSLLLSFNTTTIGKATVEVMLEHNGTRYWNTWLRLAVQLSPDLTVAADVLGWIYSIAWDISFLPQIIHNWRRGSVSGLSFDFLLFNFIGFSSYFIFNAGLLWIPEMQAQYFERYPSGVIHVRFNDVFFALYALVCTLVQIFQAFILERAKGQRVSTTCWVLSGMMVAFVGACAIAAASAPSFWWLDVLYAFSYIKIAVTAIKYTPQLLLNYKTKSTAGWSITMVALDFTGGFFSIIQMILLAANYDNWYSILTDPAKMGLGLLSVFFNIFFFIQHFCLYREPPQRLLKKDSIETRKIDAQMKF